MPIDRDGDGPPLRREDAPSPASRADAKPAAPRPNDLRATPFTDDVFDDEYYGRRRSKGVSIGLIGGVILGAMVAAAAGWYVLGTREPSVATAAGGPVDGLIKADPNPYKVKPDDPGGLQVENQDKLVYERLDKSAKANTRVENLLPEPEQPKAPPLKKAAEARTEQAPQPTATASDDPLAKLVAKLEGVKETPPPETPAAAPPAAAPSPPAPTQVAAATPAEALPVIPSEASNKPMMPMSPLPSPAAAPSPPPVRPAANGLNAPLQLGPKPAPEAEAVSETPAPSPAAPSPPAPTQVAAVPPPATAPAAASVAAPAPTAVANAPQAATPASAAPSAGAVFLQLASARTEDAALGEWKRISSKNTDLLGDLMPSVVQADLGDRGTYFRLRAGPVADRSTAEGLCTSLLSRNVGCIVVRP